MALKPCRECGEQVSEAAKTCPSCGIKSPARKPIGCLTGLVFAFGIWLALQVVLGVIGHNSTPELPLADPQKQPTKTDKEAAGRVLYLVSLSEKSRAATLGKVVGGGCIGQSSFFMATGHDKSFWSVKCANGQSFSVEVNPNGTSKVVECSVLAAWHAGHYFQPLEK